MKTLTARRGDTCLCFAVCRMQFRSQSRQRKPLHSTHTHTDTHEHARTHTHTHTHTQTLLRYAPSLALIIRQTPALAASSPTSNTHSSLELGEVARELRIKLPLPPAVRCITFIGRDWFKLQFAAGVKAQRLNSARRILQFSFISFIFAMRVR